MQYSAYKKPEIFSKCYTIVVKLMLHMQIQNISYIYEISEIYISDSKHFLYI